MSLRVICVAFFLTFAGCASFQNDAKERALLHQQIGQSYYASERYPEALTEFLKAEKLDPKNPLVQNNLALVYYARNRYELAEKHLLNAISLDEKYTDARNNLARLYIEQKKYPQAEELLKVVLNDLTYPDVARAYTNFGLSRFQQKDWTLAQNYFTKALQLKKDDCNIHTYLGRTYLEQGFYSQSTSILDRAIGLCQKEYNDEAHYYSALAWYRLGDKKRSLARFEELVKIYPEGKFRDRAQAMSEVVKKELHQ